MIKKADNIHNRAYKYRIYPNATQVQQLTHTFGCVRFVWNSDVAAFNSKSNPKTLKELKIEHPFLNNVSCAVLQQKNRDFIQFKNQFFNKNRKSKVNRPKFKKKGNNESFRLPNQKFSILGDKLKLERLGLMKYVCDREIPKEAKLISITISKNTYDQYYASIVVEEKIEPKVKTKKTVGIDLGIKTFIVTSDNKQYKSNKYFRENQSKLRTAQKYLSRKVKGSIRYKKCKRKVAKQHLDVANKRSHYIHEITNEIVSQYDVIVIEDLNVKGMVNNRKLAKSISDAGFGLFRQQLTYKCAWYGKELIVADRFFASSKTCSCCGNVKKDLKLSERTYNCDVCATIIDRDLNAAINLKHYIVKVPTKLKPSELMTVQRS